MTDTPAPAGKAGARPGAVMVAFWLLIVGAVMLMAGGLLTATTGFDTVRQTTPASVSDQSVRDLLRFYRGVGILFCVAAAVLAGSALRTRDGDPRFRRATMALGLAIIVLVALAALLTGAVFILALLSLLPIVGGVMVLNRPAVAQWFVGGSDGEWNS
ncbi:MAG: hypothetical protein KDB71_09280 [Mycobacterium sp.]|nr:hypothetical protein [Mycobacterium sp.]